MLRTAFLASFLAGVALAAAPSVAEPGERAALEGAIVESLVRRETDSAAVARWKDLQEAVPARSPALPRDGGATRLECALEDLRNSLPADRSPVPGDLPALLAAYDRVKAADLLVRAHFAAAADRLETAGGAQRGRLADAERRYEASAATLFGELDAAVAALGEPGVGKASEGARAAVAVAFERLRGRLDPVLARDEPPILRANTLPYRRSGLAARPPKKQPAVVPSYADPAAGAATSADLAAGPEAPLSPEILELAASLGHDYVRIYEFVQGEIATEWYAGSTKGALGTLRARAGNDVDQASLLVALFRASLLGARYVHGVVELPVEAVAADLGLADPALVPTALARAGVAHAPIVRGGRVAAVEVEHTWVAAYAPYANYRGAVVDFSGRTWIPLDPSTKASVATGSTAVLRQMGLAVDELVAEHLTDPASPDLLLDLRQRVGEWLADEAPGESYEDQLGARAVAREELGLLPSTLAVPVVAVTGESPALGDEHRVRLRFVARAGVGEGSSVILTEELPAFDLVGSRVTLSYLPATVDDHRAVDAFGGLATVPAYLVAVRPQVKVQGRPVLVGSGSVGLGLAHRIEVEVLSPAGNERISSVVLAGSYHALAVGASGTPAAVPAEGDLADSESLAAELLASIGHRLDARWSAAEAELAGLLDVTVLRPWPSLALVSNAVAADELLGQPFGLRWQGVTLDAALRVAEPLARHGDAAAPRDFQRLSGLYGSSLEHRLFEEVFLVESVSADKGLALARSVGAEVLRLATEGDDPRLHHPLAVETDVAAWLRLGMIVEVPAEPIAHRAWAGSVWRVEDPATGAAGYFLSGGLAGGATSEAPESWLLDFLRDALLAAYSSEPNADPLSGVEVAKVSSGDGQTGEVGSILPVELAVLVRDGDGRPVRGAEVTFWADASGVKLLDGDGGFHDSRTIPTDALGRASVAVRLGEHTDAQPFFTLVEESDRHTTKALLQEIEVTVRSESGLLVPREPFQALAYPGEPMSLRRTDTDEVHFTPFLVGGHVDSMTIEVADRFGNPVSNVPVAASVGEAVVPEVECRNQRPESFANAAVFEHASCDPPHPLLGECGGETVSVETSALGAGLGVILGNDVVRLYRVEVAADGLEPLAFTYSTVFTGGGTDACDSFWIVGLVKEDYLSFEGHNVSAARAGTRFARPVRATLVYWQPEHQVATNSEGELIVFRTTDGELVRTTGDVTFTVDNGGSASPAESPEEGVYQTEVTTGLAPALHTVTAEALDVEHFDSFSIDVGTGEVFRNTTHSDLSGVMAEVYGVEPRIAAFTPDPVVLTDAGHSEEPVTLDLDFAPEDYFAAGMQIELYEDDELVGRFTSAEHQPPATARIHRGFAFDREKRYDAELILNGGSLAEVRSDKSEVALHQRLLREVKDFVAVGQDVDVLNGRVCETPDVFEFGLNQPARVTLTFRKVESLEVDLSPNLGPELRLLDGALFPEGNHAHPLTTEDLPAGDYRFELRAVAEGDGRVETKEGFARSSYEVSDTLPVGHAMAKGVDVWSGALAVGREDFTVPGRGAALSFYRTYSSHGHDDEGGPLGSGWSHNYQSRLIVTPCGEAIVIGGEGSGMRFVDDGAGGLRPLRGYHGSLVANPDHSFDFFSKSGNRYRYIKGPGSEWLLESITDPNDNRTELAYVPGAEEPLLVAVRDAAGRQLSFEYASRSFAFWSGAVLARVEGPGGLAVHFEYDAFGNLVRAEREPHGDGGRSQAEEYVYDFVPSGPYPLSQALVATRDAIRDATTRYAYELGSLPAGDGLTVEALAVREVIEPEDGVTRFEYGLSTNPEGPETRVTDRRGEVTTYTFNRYGSPVRIVDPEDHATVQEWAADDVVMTARVDANGVRTDFTYGTEGNLLTETVEVTDGFGVSQSLVRTTTYRPLTTFDPPYIKDRPATRTDRDGNTTHFEYDARGNLAEERIVVATVDGPTAVLRTTHTYLANGDRASTTDPRGETTFFRYDANGYVEETTDARGGVTRTEWDVRGRPLRQIDPLGRVTELEHDTLGRLVRRVLPAVAGETAEERTVHDDAARTRIEIDPLGRETVTQFDREGRVLAIANAAGGERHYEYDPEGNTTLDSGWFDATTPRADVGFEYDRAGRLVRRTEPLGRVTTYVHDAAGNVLREELADAADPGFVPRVSEFTYDELNRRLEERHRLGEEWVVSRKGYDGEGRVILEVDPLGRENRHRHDALGRLLETIEPEWTAGKPRTLQNVYDGSGNLIETRLLTDASPQVRRFEYDELGRLVKQIDAVGQARTFEYDAVGNRLREVDARLDTTSYLYDERNRRIATTVHLERVTSPRRRVTTTFRYDAVGNQIEETWPNGNVIVHAYDPLNRRTSTVDSLGTLSETGYDARSQLVRAVDANGNETLSTYDLLGRLTRKELPEDRVLTFAYDAAGNPTAATNARSFTTRSVYDELNRSVEVIDPEPFSYRQTFTYDLVGNRLSETDRRGNTTRFVYDALDRLVRRIEAPLAEGEEPLESLFTYDAAGNRRTETDRRGITTEHRYDAENRRIETARAGLVIEGLEYTTDGNVRTRRDANGNLTTYEYEERDLLVAENRPLAAITRYAYDDEGDRVSTRDPEGRVTAATYDLRRRMESQSSAAHTATSETTTYGYDGNGNRTEMIRPEGNGWTHEYDGANRLVAVVDPESARTEYRYDANGNLIEQDDANRHVTSFSYDELDRRTRRTYPDGVFERTGYDESGNVTSEIDARGRTRSHAYDSWNRRTLTTLPQDEATVDDLLAIAQTWDPNSNVIATRESFSESGDQLTTRAYDTFDRLEAITDRWGRALHYRYDANGNRVLLTDPAGEATQYAFDQLNRLTSVSTGAGVTTYTYFRDGRVKSLAHPNGTTATTTYDASGRTESIRNDHLASLVSRFTYRYDRNGNRLEQVEEHSGRPAETTTYAFDDSDRLLEVRYPDQATTYAYDPVGNRLSERSTAVADGSLLVDRAYAYDLRDRLERFDDELAPAESVVYAFDANGNQTSRTTGAGAVTTFAWDVLDRMIRVEEDGLPVGTYRYNASSLRIEKLTAEGTARYLYDAQAVLQRDDANGATKYRYGSDRLLAVTDPAGGVGHYLHDSLGSVVDITSPDGLLLARYSYDAWGNYRDRLDFEANPFGFTGHEHDSESGLIYARARFIDPELGLFLSVDPFDGLSNIPPSLHRYLYAQSNPLYYVDPSGQCVLGLPCPANVRWAISNTVDTQVAAATALVQTVAEVVGGAAQGAVATVDVATLGAVSDAKARVQTFLETPGTLTERAQAANEAGVRARVAAVTVGFSEADDAGAHARGLVRGVFAAEQLEQGFEQVAEGLSERDGEQVLRGGAKLLGGASQVTLVVAGAAKTTGLSRVGRAPKKPTIVTENPSGAGVVEQPLAPTQQPPAKGLYERGTFRKAPRESAVGEAPRNATAEMTCPTCDEVIPESITKQTKRGPVERVGYDLDHYPDTWAERVKRLKERPAPPSRAEVLDEYNRDLRVQCPSCNQGHQFEGKPTPEELQ